MGEESALKILLVILSIGSLAIAAGIPILLWIMSGIRNDVAQLFTIVNSLPPRLATHKEKINALERAVERRRDWRGKGTS